MSIEESVKKIIQKNQFMLTVFEDIVKSQTFNSLVDQITRAKTYNELPEFVFSGVGKNWYICQKVTKVFLSLGLKAQPLDCDHAIHGDLGMLTGDRPKVLFFVSKSGSSDQLVKLAKVVKYLRDDIKHLQSNLKTVGLFLVRDQGQRSSLYDTLITPSQKFDGVLYPQVDDRDIIPSLTINTMQSVLQFFGSLVYQRYPELVQRYKYNHLAGANGRRLGVSKILQEL